MRTLLRVAVVLFSIAICARAFSGEPKKSWLSDPRFVPLWTGDAPGAQGKTDGDIPAVMLFKPEAGKENGAAIVICPGGGYGGLAPHEGINVGEWAAKNGILGVVLRYRLGPKYHHPVELGDAQRAIRYTRAHAEEWKIDPKRVGILGFSAGGHLASSASTHYTDGDPKAEDAIERQPSRPDFSVLIYPVIKMGPTGHMGSTNNLLGKNPDPALIELLTNDKQVNEKTPPAFLVHGIDDKTVPVANSEDYAAALKKANVECELIKLDHGPHGFGLGNDNVKTDWPEKCVEWLKKIKMVPDAK